MTYWMSSALWAQGHEDCINHSHLSASLNVPDGCNLRKHLCAQPGVRDLHPDTEMYHTDQIISEQGTSAGCGE